MCYCYLTPNHVKQQPMCPIQASFRFSVHIMREKKLWEVAVEPHWAHAHGLARREKRRSNASSRDIEPTSHDARSAALSLSSGVPFHPYLTSLSQNTIPNADLAKSPSSGCKAAMLEFDRHLELSVLRFCKSTVRTQFPFKKGNKPPVK